MSHDAVEYRREGRALNRPHVLNVANEALSELGAALDVFDQDPDA